MVKRSSDEPADKASERLHQWEESRKPVPAEEDNQEAQQDEISNKEKESKKKSKTKSNKKR